MCAPVARIRLEKGDAAARRRRATCCGGAASELTQSDLSLRGFPAHGGLRGGRAPVRSAQACEGRCAGAAGRGGGRARGRAAFRKSWSSGASFCIACSRDVGRRVRRGGRGLRPCAWPGARARARWGAVGRGASGAKHQCSGCSSTAGGAGRQRTGARRRRWRGGAALPGEPRSVCLGDCTRCARSQRGDGLAVPETCAPEENVPGRAAVVCGPGF
jgi:hypothetical protein